MLISPSATKGPLPKHEEHRHTASVSLFKQAQESFGLDTVFLNPGRAEGVVLPGVPHVAVSNGRVTITRPCVSRAERIAWFA